MRETSPKSRDNLPGPTAPARSSISEANKKSASSTGGVVIAAPAPGNTFMDSAGNDLSDSDTNTLAST